MSTNSWLGFLLKLIESGGDGARILRQLREQLELPNWSYLPGHRHQQGWPGWWLGKFGGKFGRRVCQLHASDQQCQFPRGLQVMSTSYHQAWYCEKNKGEENKNYREGQENNIHERKSFDLPLMWNDPVWHRYIVLLWTKQWQSFQATISKCHPAAFLFKQQLNHIRRTWFQLGLRNGF